MSRDLPIITKEDDVTFVRGALATVVMVLAVGCTPDYYDSPPVVQHHVVVIHHPPTTIHPPLVKSPLVKAPLRQRIVQRLRRH